ncbi:MAG: SDR family oxidoreductase [Synergistaceae bacterium]|nr:SDR family oxidoreductase [Synergistaceae bacterium]
MKCFANQTYNWLVTGAAGFIGSHIAEFLLTNGQNVAALDNFSTGSERNIEQMLDAANAGENGASASEKKFRLIRGDIRDHSVCTEACRGMDFVLHHAALASVPLSLENPIETNDVNVSGFLNVLDASREAGVKRFIYASSSAVYGDDAYQPKTESRVGTPLSPYAATKSINETYAAAYNHIYDIECVGLRYFNVFGSRQDPEGAYAAVIPRWFNALMKKEPVIIYGDGENTRDFCYVKDIAKANICAAATENKRALGNVFNIGLGKQTSLNELFEIVKSIAAPKSDARPQYEAFREGDIRHSVAGIDSAASALGFKPDYSLQQGLKEAARWYVENL